MHFLVYLGKFCEAQTKFCLVTNLPDVTASPDSLLWFVALCKLNKMYPVSALLKSLISLKQLHALMTSCLLLCCKRNAPENKKNMLNFQQHDGQKRNQMVHIYAVGQSGLGLL